MTSIADNEAIANFGGLLERVAHGEQIVITREGKQVAMLLPLVDITSPQDPRDAVARWRDARKGLKLGVRSKEFIIEGRR